MCELQRVEESLRFGGSVDRAERFERAQRLLEKIARFRRRWRNPRRGHASFRRVVAGADVHERALGVPKEPCGLGRILDEERLCDETVGDCVEMAVAELGAPTRDLSRDGTGALVLAGAQITIGEPEAEQ